MNFFEQIDNYFLKRQAGVSALGEVEKPPKRPYSKPTITVRKPNSLDGFGDFVRASLLDNSGALNGLDGWKDDREAFKIELVNDLKTAIFSKWEKPWKPQKLAFGETGELILRPRNIKGRIYQRNNLLLTDQTTPFFVTPSYVAQHGGVINDKSKGQIVISFVPQFKDKGKDAPKKGTKSGADFWIPRLISVINVAHVSGIKVPTIEYKEIKPAQLIEYVENFIAKLKELKRVPKITNNQNDSCHYKHTLTWVDSIEMTPPHAFKKIDYFYSVLLHEIIHSTQNPSRCGRGTKLAYANEELVAEIGSLILSSELGLDYNRQNKIAYLRGWLKRTNNVDNALLEAYSYASDAVDYLLKDIDIASLLPKSITTTPPTNEKKVKSKRKSFKQKKDGKVKDSLRAKGENISPIVKKSRAKSKKVAKRVRGKRKQNEPKVLAVPTPKVVEKIPKVVVEKPERSNDLLPKKVTKNVKATPYITQNVAVKHINIDKSRFQNRLNAFSEESKNRIVKAVDLGEFDYAKFDPVILWRDKESKMWLLSGHSRLEAFKELSKTDKNFEHIPAKFFSGSEAQAIDLALNSNTLATKETEVERAVYYAKQRVSCELKSKGLNGKTSCEKQVEDKCKNAEGRNANYILNLSFLNPNGNLIADLNRFGIDKDNENTTILRNIANWIGEARRNNRLISDIQESEIAKYLLSTGYGNKKGQFKRKQDFLDRLQWSFDKWINRGAKEGDALNLANTIGKDIFEKEWDDRMADAKRELETAITNHEEKHKKYVYAVMDGTISEARMNELLKPFILAIELAKKEVENIRNQEGAVKESSKRQGSLFGLSKFSTTTKTKTEQLSGDLGAFLGEYDRQNYSIVLRGEKGAGKSRLTFQIVNLFAEEGLKVAFASLEMHPNSSVMQRYKDEYLSAKGLENIDITSEQLSYEQLNKICKQYDMVAIDSWTKLKAIEQNDFDRLQKENPRTIILSIFQSTTGKVTRGGNMPEYDAGVVIQVNKGGFAECEKNRYAPCDKIYNVFDKSLVNSSLQGVESANETRSYEVI